jgi:hypothetical protein
MSVTIIIQGGSPDAIKSGLAKEQPAATSRTEATQPDSRAAELAAKFVLRPTMDDVKSAECLESCAMYAKKLMNDKKFKEFKSFYDKLEPHMDQDARDRFRSVMGA